MYWASVDLSVDGPMWLQEFNCFSEGECVPVGGGGGRTGSDSIQVKENKTMESPQGYLHTVQAGDQEEEEMNDEWKEREKKQPWLIGERQMSNGEIREKMEGEDEDGGQEERWKEREREFQEEEEV